MGESASSASCGRNVFSQPKPRLTRWRTGFVSQSNVKLSPRSSEKTSAGGVHPRWSSARRAKRFEQRQSNHDKASNSVPNTTRIVKSDARVHAKRASGAKLPGGENAR